MTENVNREKAIELVNITKHFKGVYANKNINISLYKGEILAILGENGSGKTTLMNMLAGIYQPEEGEIYVNGNLASISSPNDSFNYGIGMVHQHYKLVDIFTAEENILLGFRKESKSEVIARVNDIVNKYGFKINLKKKIHNMSISEKQTIEIVKVLVRNVNILILDEPTAVLTPQETDVLFDVLRKMRNDGKSIIIITHKLNEVMAISDRVAILRKGEYITSFETAKTNERELTDYMVGKKVDLKLERLKILASPPVLEIRQLNIMKDDGTVAIENLDFFLRGGQILGVAGIAGCGQKEMCEALVGLRPYKGYITHNGKSIVGYSPEQIRNLGIYMSFIPEDRLGIGLAPSLSITDNMMLKDYKDNKGIFVDREKARAKAENLIERYNVVTPSTETPVKNLSGGNVQKILVGREIGLNPNVLITAYPVRGLDINSSYMIYDILNQEKAKNTAILFIGEDLDVLMTFCDKIMVLCHGKNMGVVHTKNTTKEEIGLMMTGSKDLSIELGKTYGIASDSLLSEEEWNVLMGKEVIDNGK
ncbi:MAG: ABC transporter ATP-binding protein [Bacilli bacterium]|nr:ABC transporter ATP-binding protein [Bacilli bacterium]